MFQTPKDHKSRPLRGSANLLLDSLMTTLSKISSVFCAVLHNFDLANVFRMPDKSGSNCSFARLTPDVFAYVSNSLPLIWLRWSDFSDLSRHLANFFFIDALHRDCRWRVKSKLNPLRRLDLNRVTKPDGQHEVLALLLGSISYTMDF